MKNPMFVLGNETSESGERMCCSERLVPTERKEKMRQDVHAAELASSGRYRRSKRMDGSTASDLRPTDRPRIFLLWPTTWRVSRVIPQLYRTKTDGLEV